MITSKGLVLAAVLAFASSVAQAQWSGPDGSGRIFYNGGSVGIGTATPPTAWSLQLFRSDPGAKIFAIQSSSNGAGVYADTEMLADKQAFSLRAYGSGFTTFSHAGITLTNMAEFWADELVPGGNKGLLIGTNVSSANPPVIIAAGGTERMRILATGQIGIGTTTPAVTLDVNGSVNVSGNIAAKYQDVAEWVPATEKLLPGMVVVLNRSKVNEVNASASAYDTGVAGVVSSKPGLILGEANSHSEQIATTGRVKVRADATGSPIAVGDLLVTSDTAGMVMKSQPVEFGGIEMHRPGTIVGKALEPLSSGRGEILILLSLQ